MIPIGKLLFFVCIHHNDKCPLLASEQEFDYLRTTPSKKCYVSYSSKDHGFVFSNK